MGLYTDHILPRCIACGMGHHKFAKQRVRAFEHVSGRVLELGFGAGHNLPCYPAAVTEVLAIEPALVNRKLARKRVEVCPIPVKWVGLRGEEIPLEDASVDAVTSAWTMCTIPELRRALCEVKRVLRPGGALYFLEHGLSPDPKVAKWQRRLTPCFRLCGGGCHLDRAIDVLIRDAGFEIHDLAHPAFAGPKAVTYLYRGVATPRG